jgi:hypothetical protein
MEDMSQETTDHLSDEDVDDDDLYSDFLSYQDIDKDVDELYRAFLDTTLIRRALESNHEATYKEKVATLRRQYLDPNPRPRLDVDGPATSDKADDDKFIRARRFLYWFDVRADYWWRARPSKHLLDALLKPSELALLHEQAHALQLRIDAAKAQHGFRNRETSIDVLEKLVKELGDRSPKRESEPRAAVPRPESTAHAANRDLLQQVMDASKEPRPNSHGSGSPPAPSKGSEPPKGKR